MRMRRAHTRRIKSAYAWTAVAIKRLHRAISKICISARTFMLKVVMPTPLEHISAANDTGQRLSLVALNFPRPRWQRNHRNDISMTLEKDDATL